MNKQLVAVSIAALGAIAAGSAAAEESGFYAGASSGTSRLSARGDHIDGAFANQGLTTSTALERHDTPYDLTLGYRLNRNFAVEGNYIDFGRYKFESNVSAPAADTINGSFRARGVDVEAVGIVPLEHDFSAYGKAGVLWAKTKLDAGSSGAVPVSDESHSHASLTYGLGVRYDVTRKWSGNLEWNHYARVGDAETTGRTSANLFTIGAAYHF